MSTEAEVVDDQEGDDEALQAELDALHAMAERRAAAQVAAEEALNDEEDDEGEGSTATQEDMAAAAMESLSDAEFDALLDDPQRFDRGLTAEELADDPWEKPLDSYAELGTPTPDALTPGMGEADWQAYYTQLMKDAG